MWGFVYHSLEKHHRNEPFSKHIKQPTFFPNHFFINFLRQVPEATKAIMVYFQQSLCGYHLYDTYIFLGSTKPFNSNLALQYYLPWIAVFCNIVFSHVKELIWK